MAGVVGAVVWGLASYAAIGDRVDDFARDGLPGQVTVPIDTPGTYAVFYEAADTDRVPALDVAVTGPDGTAVPVAAYAADLRFDRDDTVSRAVATFDTPRPGDYVVTATGVAPGGATFAVGAVPATGVAAVVGAVVLLFASLGAGTLIALVTLVLRNRDGARQHPVDSAPRTPAGVA